MVGLIIPVIYTDKDKENGELRGEGGVNLMLWSWNEQVV